MGHPGHNAEGITQSNRLDSDTDRVKKKSITQVLHDYIIMTTSKDSNNEISVMKVENDLVTSFLFDNIGKFSD
jgi:hypothetical protein